MLSRTPLSQWTLHVDPDGPTPLPPQAQALVGRELAATVPGAVHDDLRTAGLIEDPFLDDNELRVAWVSRTDWAYRTSIDPAAATGHERVELVFDGLDTVAQVELAIPGDGAGAATVIGTSQNMHRRYRYDITDLLTGPSGPGPHPLAVRLSSAYTEAEARQDRLGRRPNAYPEPFNQIRKMACSFGWDWGPTVVGAGIWRPARVEAWSTARIAGSRPLVDVSDGVGTLRLLLDLDRTTTGSTAALGVEVMLDGKLVASAPVSAGQDHVEVVVDVPNVRVWEPAGYGTADLYHLQVQLLSADGEALDVRDHRIGFRSLELDRSTDDAGTRFVFRINGRPVLIKGVNWIPDDVLPGRMTRERYARRLREAAAIGVNLIRVWGGGIYESDDFYDLCDELGLLVWQDFPFACAAYPEDEPLVSEIAAEAADNVERLAAHPSLVVWNGNNECLWLHEADGWAGWENGELPWGQRYYLQDLPAIVAAVDPSRPYTAGSPWSGSWDHEPNDPEHQTFHSWDVWNRLDYKHYRDSTPRFVAEFGWQAPPAWTTLRDTVSDDPITPDSPGVRWHQKAQDGNDKLERGLAPHFPTPSDVDAWHYLTQLNQVRAIETGIRHWRAHWPHTAGTIVWQLNDLWPVTSWAAIDGAGRYKPLYFALRELYAPRALTIEPDGDGLRLVVLNDSDKPWSGRVAVRRLRDDGEVRARAALPVHVAARSVADVPLPRQLATFEEPWRELLVADLAGRRALWHGTAPIDSHFARADPTLSVTTTPDGLHISVTARTVLRDLLVQPDRIRPRATTDHGFLTLLPGETVTVAVRCGHPLPAEAASAPWAISWLDRVL